MRRRGRVLAGPICSLQRAGGYTGCMGCDQHCETIALTESGQTVLCGDNPSVQEGLRLDGFRLRRVNEMKQEGKKKSQSRTELCLYRCRVNLVHGDISLLLS